MLAMDVNDDAGCLTLLGTTASIASVLAPTEKRWTTQGAFEKQYRLSLLQVFAMRQ
ncbi:hypothetical protein [Pseudomonas sp. R37(2017)]|uniref:hypothetical protein n=1 Tax=Pseudomonas sp. R37(2017) TaxID=1981685 RepID=UPI0015B24764|nr:hypothetical protein [Pseudomonas sp. R37(2017)]